MIWQTNRGRATACI